MAFRLDKCWKEAGWRPLLDGQQVIFTVLTRHHNFHLRFDLIIGACQTVLSRLCCCVWCKQHDVMHQCIVDCIWGYSGTKAAAEDVSLLA